jgi:hypothetical protein
MTKKDGYQSYTLKKIMMLKIIRRIMAYSTKLPG